MRAIGNTCSNIKPVLLEADCMQAVVAEWDKAGRRGGRKQERDMYGYNIVQNTRMWNIHVYM